MKKIFAILVLCVGIYAIQPFTYFWTITPTNSQVTTQKWRANNDSVLYWAGRLCDTVNTVMIRKSWIKDTVFDSINVKKLKHCDSIYTRVIKATVFDSIITYKTITGRRLTLTSWLSADSVNSRAANLYKLNVTNSAVINSANTTLLTARQALIDTITDTYVANIDSIKARVIHASSAIIDNYDTISASKVIDNSITYGYAVISYVMEFKANTKTDTVKYKRRVEGGDTLIDLWFKGTIDSSVTTTFSTSFGVGLPDYLRPKDSLCIGVIGLNDSKICPLKCVIKNNGEVKFQTANTNDPYVIYSAFGVTGKKGYYPFFTSYLKR